MKDICRLFYLASRCRACLRYIFCRLSGVIQVPNNSVGLPWWLNGKESACSAGDLGSIPGLKIPWRRKWLPTPVFLPGESHGQRSLAGHSPGGCK